MSKRIVLVNLGGIETVFDIPEFLFRMFNDRHILPIGQPFRAFLSALITLFRMKGTFDIYRSVKASPVIKITKKQSEMLSKIFNDNVDYRFSYSKPIIKKSSKSLAIPLYGFYSHTTHGSILKKYKYVFPPLCIFPEFFDLIEKRIKDIIDKHKKHNVAILFSAHSLPKSLENNTKDPYRHDLEVFVGYFKKRLVQPVFLSFQSKLGPIEWLEPSTSDKIKELSNSYDCIIVVPISFISDNTETVYEIDVEYKKIAQSCGIKCFDRVECFNDDKDFIKFLGKVVWSKYS